MKNNVCGGTVFPKIRRKSMKKALFLITAVLTVFAMVMTGCDDGSGGGGGGGNTPTVTEVKVSPATVDVSKGKTANFRATVTGTNSPAQTVTWEVTGGITSTSISTTGVLTVAAEETATTLTVKATSTVNTSISGTATVTVIEAPGVKIKVGSAVQTVEVDAVKGTITYLDDKTGFIYEATDPDSGGYGNEFPKFKVDLGAGKNLTDYESLKITYQGISGDVGWKTLYLQAQENEPTGYFNISSNNVASFNYSNDGLTAANVTFTLVPTTVITITTQEVWFVINPHAASASNDGVLTSFQVSGIELVAASTPFVPVKVSTEITLRAPVGEETPGATVSGTGYTGTVEWKNNGAALTGNFVTGTIYTATITLTKNPGYTFNGIAANAFTVTGSSNVSNPAGTANDNTLVVTATFPAATGAIPVKIIDFTTAGVTAIGSSTVGETLADSYTYETTNYGQGAYFKVTFDTGFKLSDYSKLDLTFEGLSGDTGYKNARVAISASEITSVSENGYLVASTNNGGQTEGHAAEVEKNLSIPSTLDEAIDKNEVYVAIYFWSNAAKWKISGVKFHN
jgi:hypothetical protein